MVLDSLADAQIETLVFVLDGVLRNIPMAALYDGQQYLIEKYTLTLAPGLTLVDPQPLTGQPLAAIAAGLSESRHGFSPLTYVRSEVKQIQETLTSRALLDAAFTQATLEAEINQTPFPIVHLTTHGQFSSNPAALRQAQLALLRQHPGYQHPHYWAPFVLVGNWL